MGDPQRRLPPKPQTVDRMLRSPFSPGNLGCRQLLLMAREGSTSQSVASFPPKYLPSKEDKVYTQKPQAQPFNSDTRWAKASIYGWREREREKLPFGGGERKRDFGANISKAWRKRRSASLSTTKRGMPAWG